MKINAKFAAAALGLAALVLLTLTLASGAQASTKLCSNASLRGTYAATLTGTVNGAPFAALDEVTSDGNGNMTGSGTIVANGTVIPTTFTATYTVNSDCSGSFVSSTGTNENLIVKMDGSQVQFIVTSTPLGPATVTGVGNNIAD